RSSNLPCTPRAPGSGDSCWLRSPNSLPPGRTPSAERRCASCWLILARTANWVRRVRGVRGGTTGTTGTTSYPPYASYLKKKGDPGCPRSPSALVSRASAQLALLVRLRRRLRRALTARARALDLEVARV